MKNFKFENGKLVVKSDDKIRIDKDILIKTIEENSEEISKLDNKKLPEVQMELEAEQAKLDFLDCSDNNRIEDFKSTKAGREAVTDIEYHIISNVFNCWYGEDSFDKAWDDMVKKQIIRDLDKLMQNATELHKQYNN